MPGIFSLNSWPDLLKKLEWEFARLQADPDNEYIAYNFFVTAWHLLEWQYPDPVGTATRSRIRDAEPIFLVCEHLAIGAKHFTPTQTRLDSVQKSAMNEGAWGDAWGGAWGQSWGRGLSVTLQGRAEQALGASIYVGKLSLLVMNYWREVERATPPTDAQ